MWSRSGVSSPRLSGAPSLASHARLRGVKKGRCPMGELRDRMEADLRLRGYAEKTRVAYVSCIRAVARHFRRSPATLGEDEIRAYLTYLIDDPVESDSPVPALRRRATRSSRGGRTARRS